MFSEEKLLFGRVLETFRTRDRVKIKPVFYFKAKLTEDQTNPQISIVVSTDKGLSQPQTQKAFLIVNTDRCKG